jgi:hypothetical protein
MHCRAGFAQPAARLALTDQAAECAPECGPAEQGEDERVQHSLDEIYSHEWVPPAPLRQYTAPPLRHRVNWIASDLSRAVPGACRIRATVRKATGLLAPWRRRASASVRPTPRTGGWLNTAEGIVEWSMAVGRPPSTSTNRCSGR